MASANKSLGRFDLAEIPPAPRGMPQIEVTFDIDANGILHVSAKDKATGKQQTIQIKASSGLNEDEIKRMVKDAEEHKDQDRKFHELVDARNKADALIHATEKSLKDVGDKISSDDKSNIEKAVADLKAAIKGADKAEIDTKTEALNKASAKMAEQLYAKQGAAGAPGVKQAEVLLVEKLAARKKAVKMSSMLNSKKSKKIRIKIRSSSFVIPAKAGIHSPIRACPGLDPGSRTSLILYRFPLSRE
jgi:molecular chaperone DnaK